MWSMLLGEIQAETSQVAQFLIDREIEAPERYSAVQSYRVAMAVLRQQRLFVEVRPACMRCACSGAALHAQLLSYEGVGPVALAAIHASSR